MINSKLGLSGFARFAAPRALGKFLSGMAAATFLIACVARSAWALPIIPLQVSTDPGNGDQNPYGVVFVPAGFPDNTVPLGHVLVANFNDASNNQGQGTTITNVRPTPTQAPVSTI